MLITDSEYLQKATFDAGVVGKLSKMLKISYDPVPETANTHPWSPAGEEYEQGADAPSPRLGRNGQSPLLVHKIKVRESTLKAIAALVPFKDDYRKAIVDQGVVPYIVESMSSTPGKPSPKSSDKSEKVLNHSPVEESKQGYGINPVNVLIAACGAVRALSRSVSVLRTTLIDSGVAEPVFRLLQHSDIEVQIAATATVCNLLTDVSPMREVSSLQSLSSTHLTDSQPISEAGVLKILCEHAHSMNAKLRLNALWALKHFVHGVSNEMKRLCLEELGQGWLVQLICDDTEDEALLSSRGKGERSHTPMMKWTRMLKWINSKIKSILHLGHPLVVQTIRVQAAVEVSLFNRLNFALLHCETQKRIQQGRPAKMILPCKNRGLTSFEIL
jgi:hypothetical protein